MTDEWLEHSGKLTGEVSLEIVGGQGEITTQCRADCYYRNGSFYLLFQENIAEDGKKGSLTFSSRLKIGKEQVVLRRSLGDQGGTTKQVMEMTYRKLAADQSGSVIDYPTPYGVLRLEIRTEELSVLLQEGQLLAEISYLMLQDGREAARDQIKIRVIK